MELWEWQQAEAGEAVSQYQVWELMSGSFIHAGAEGHHAFSPAGVLGL